MSQQFSLKANHRDTFRLVPVGSTDPGDYIHSPTDATGFAYFVAEPANYYVYCRPAYTGEFVLLNSQVGSGYQYLRTVNPEIDSDGIISLASLVNNLTTYIESEFNNLPYVTTNELLSIRVLSTAGGVPSTGLQSAPDVTLYRKPGGTSESLFVALATYEPGLYDTANPHIYYYSYTFDPNTIPAQDFYYFRANASYEGINSVDYPDAQWFQLDYDPPSLVSANVLLSSTSSTLGDNMNNTSTASCFVSMPESSVTDNLSGPEKIHLQPFLMSQDQDDLGNPGGLEYMGAGSGDHVFEDQHLWDDDTQNPGTWALSQASGFDIVIGPDDSGNSFLYRNYGAAYGGINHFTIQNLGVPSGGDYVEITIDDLEAPGENTTGSQVTTDFVIGSFYQYKLFYYHNYAYCDGDATITVEETCTSANHTWKSAAQSVKDWPIEFAYGGNIVQNVLLTQSVPPAFVADMEGVEYGFLISATDKALNTNVSYEDFLKPSIVFDTIVELAPNLAWWFAKNQTDYEDLAYVNEYGWFKTGAELNQGICSDNGQTTQETCCTAGTGTWTAATETCTSSSNTWTHDHLTLILQSVDNNQQQNTQYGVQVSFDGITWTEYSQIGTNNLVGGTSSTYWVNAEIKQGSNTLYVRALHADGGITGNTYAIEYKWDKEYPTWDASAMTVTATGGFNRAFFTWNVGPADYGTDTTHYANNGGRLAGTLADPLEGFSGAHKIRLYRSKNAGTDPDDWDIIAADPTTYDLVEIGLFPGSLQNYTDTSFHSVDYSDTELDPYFYWGVPIDMAGNEGQPRDLQADGVLLVPPAGVTVTPLVPADVAGALGTETIIDPDNTDTIRTHRDIAVPTDGVIIRTHEVSKLAAIKYLSTSEDGVTYTSVPLVERFGESYVPIYINFNEEGCTSINNGIQFPIIGKTPADLGLDHLFGYQNPNLSGDLGVVILRIGRCKDSGGSYLSIAGYNAGAKSSCEALGSNTWEESIQPVVLDSITDDAFPTTYINLASLETSIAQDLNSTYLVDNTYSVDLGMILADNTTYALAIEPQDNKYYYRVKFAAVSNIVPTAEYCNDLLSADIHACMCTTGNWNGTICETGSEIVGAYWTQDVTLDTDGVNWSTKLAADLIVGGTLRLETGLSIWSGGYEGGFPTGSGMTMDQLGLTMFAGANETIRLNSLDGSFAMGNLDNPSGNKLSFDPSSGQLSLLGTLYQIQANNSGIANQEFVGEYIYGTCSDQQYLTEEDCCVGDGGTWNGSQCSVWTALTWTDQFYTSGQVVLYNSDYWLCILNQDPVPPAEPTPPSYIDDIHWILYASSSMEGAAATGLSIAAASSTYTADQDGTVVTPDDIRIVVNAQNISGDVIWGITAVDSVGSAVSGVNLYTDDTCSQISGATLADSTPVYLCSGNLTSTEAAAVTLTCGYTLLSDDNITLQELEDSVTITRLNEGSDSYNIILSNEAHTVTANEYGVVPAAQWNTASTSIKLFRGTEERNCTITTTISPSGTGWQATPIQASLPLYPSVEIENTINDQTEDPSAQAAIEVTDTLTGDVVGISIFTVSILYAGTSAKTVSLSASSFTYTYDPNAQAITGPDPDGDGTYAIDFDLAYPNITIQNLSWTLHGTPDIIGDYNIGTYAPGQNADDTDGTFQIISNVNGGAHKIRLFLANYLGPAHDTLTVGVTVTDANTNETFQDSVTVNKLLLGADSYVGNLSNDSYSVSADYNGNISNLADAGGQFTLYQGTNLLSSPIASFKTVGSWYGRLWYPNVADQDLNLDHLTNQLGTPDLTKTVKWNDLDSVSRIDLQSNHFFDNPNLEDWDNFTAWFTTWIKVDTNFNITGNEFAGDNAHWLYINNSIPLDQGSNPVGSNDYQTISTYDYNFTTTGGFASPTDQGSNGPWYKIDMIYSEGSGGDFVSLGWNPSVMAGTGLLSNGGGAVIGEINEITGQYIITHFNEPHADQASLVLAGLIDDNQDGVIDNWIEKVYTISKSIAGSPGTYYVYKYYTSSDYSDTASLQTFMQGNIDYDWPPDHGFQDDLANWIDTLPTDSIPGMTTFETRKLYRVDNTTIDGEVWSTPAIAGSSPLDPVVYYIKPTAGTQLLNGTTQDGGTVLTVIATQQDQTNGESDIPDGGEPNITLSLFPSGSPELPNESNFDSDAITGSLTVYLVNTDAGAVLDTISLIDVSDGLPVGSVVGTPGLVFTQAENGVWGPAAITLVVTFYNSLGEVSDYGSMSFEVTDGGEGEPGEINITVDFTSDQGDITLLAPVQGTSQLGLDFTHTPTNIHATETIYAVARGQVGETGNTGAAGPSVTYTGGWDINRSEYFAGEYSGEDPDNNQQSDDPIGEIVRFDHTSPNSGKDWHEDNGAYYICIVGHIPSIVNVPAAPNGTAGPFWQAFGAQFESVATGLLLADTVLAEEIFGDNLTLTDTFKIITPGGTCEQLTHILHDFDKTGDMADDTTQSSDNNTMHGHWQLAYGDTESTSPQTSSRMRTHHTWDESLDTGGNLYASNFMQDVTTLAINAHDVGGDDNSALLEALQPGSFIYFTPVDNLHINNHGPDAYIFKIVEDSAKKAAGYPTGVYRAHQLFTKLQDDDLDFNKAAPSEHIFQFDIEFMPTNNLGLISNNNNTGIDPGSNQQFDLNLHTGASGEGDCVGLGGTWSAALNQIDINVGGISATNQSGDQTFMVDSHQGNFTFGVDDSDAYIKYTGNQLVIKGQLYVDGTVLEEPARNISLSTDIQQFGWQLCSLSWEGDLGPFVATDADYSAGYPGATWTFNLAQDGPCLIRVLVEGAKDQFQVYLNGLPFSPTPHSSMHPAVGDDIDLVSFWYEYYDDAAPLMGENTLQFKEPFVTVDSTPFTIKNVQVFSEPNTIDIPVALDSTNLGDNPIITWSAAEITPGLLGEGGLSVPLINVTNNSATVTLTNFQNAEQGPAGTQVELEVTGNAERTEVIYNNVYSTPLANSSWANGAVQSDPALGNIISEFKLVRDLSGTGTDRVMAGISNDETNNSSYTTIDYAIYRRSLSNEDNEHDSIKVYHGPGAYSATWIASDSGLTNEEKNMDNWIFRIVLIPDVAVNFYVDMQDGQGWQEAPVSSADAGFPTPDTSGYRFDTSMYGPNCAVKDISFGNYPAETDTSKPLLASSVKVTATATGNDNGWTSDVFDSVTLIRGLAGTTGQESVTGYLTQESQSVPADTEGSWTGTATTDFIVMSGLNDVSASATFAITDTATGTTAGLSGNTLTITNITASYDAGWVQITANYGGVSIVKTFVVSLARAGYVGQDGSPGAAQFLYDNNDGSGDGYQSDGAYQFMTMNGAAWSSGFDNGLQTGFQAADSVLLNKTDTGGEDRSQFFDLLTAGSDFIYFITPTRYYHFVLTEAPEKDPGGMTNRYGFRLQIITHVVDDDSTIDFGEGDHNVYMQFGVVQPGVRGSRTYSQEICDEIAVGDGNTLAWDDELASEVASEDGGPITRDIVTQYCEDPEFPGGFTETKFYDGADWDEVAQIIDGDLVVTGSIHAQALSVDSVTAEKIVAGSVSADKMSIGASSANLLGDKIPKLVDTWGELVIGTGTAAGGWATAGSPDAVVTSTAGKYPIMHHVSVTKEVIALTVRGNNHGEILSPWIPVDASSAYSVGAMISFANGASDGHSTSPYIGIYFSDRDNPNIDTTGGTSDDLYTAGIRKKTDTDNSVWGERSWEEIAQDAGTRYGWWTRKMDTGRNVDTGGTNFGINNSQQYDDFWIPVEWMVHPAGANYDQMKTGGNLMNSWRWLAAADEDNACNYRGYVESHRMHASTKWMQLRFRLQQHTSSYTDDLGSVDDNTMLVADPFIMPGNSTFIDGGSITTNSIHADSIQTDTLDVSVELTANMIEAGTIRSTSGKTFWSLDNEVMIVKDTGGITRVKLGDLTAAETTTCGDGSACGDGGTDPNLCLDGSYC